MNAIRFGMSSLFDNEWIHYLMTDPSYLIGNSSLISIMICLASICILCESLVIQYQEMNNELHVFLFINGYKNRRIIQLNPLNTRRLALKINLLTKYLVK